MATVGYTTTPTTNSDFGTFAGQQAASAFSMPSNGGFVTNLHVYVATDSGSSNGGFLCIWDGSGNLLGSVAVTIPATEAFVAGTLGTSVFVSGGSTLFIGAQINSAGAVGLKWHYDPNGSLPVDAAHNATIPGNLANVTQFANSSMGAWATYTPAGVAHVRRSSAWTAGIIPKIRRISAWSTSTNAADRRTSAWTTGT